ncbi:MAG: NifU family protein [Planctomycetota bacterium]
MAETETDLNEKARARLGDLRFIGELTQVDANARGLQLIQTEHGAASTDDHIRLSLLVDERERVQDIRFKTLATGVPLLTFELMAEWCLGRSLEEIKQLTPARLTRDLEEWDYAFEAGTAGAGAAGQPYFVLVKAAGRGKSAVTDEPASGGGPTTADKLPWTEVGLFEKVRRVEAVLDEHVRPALASDGGGMDIVDLKTGEEENVLVVQYSGACGSCSSAIGGTMQFIEDTLELQIGVRFRLDVQAMEEDESFFSL